MSKELGCGKDLGGYYHFKCGYSDMGQTVPILCPECELKHLSNTIHLEGYECSDCEKFIPTNDESTKIEYCDISGRTIAMIEGEFIVPDNCPLNTKVVKDLPARFNHFSRIQKMAMMCGFASSFESDGILYCHMDRPDQGDLEMFLQLDKMYSIEKSSFFLFYYQIWMAK